MISKPTSKPTSKPSSSSRSDSLSAQRKKQLRTIAHSLSPIVTIAQKGLTENVSKEINRALAEHELIKIKIFAGDRLARRALTEEVCATTQSELVQSIGNIVVLYRAAEKPDPRLSNVLRHKQG